MNWVKNLTGLAPSKDEFAELAKRTRIKAGETKKLVYDKEDFCLRVQEENGDFQGSINLHNAYEEYCRVPKNERAHVLDQFFGVMEKLPETLDGAITNILPRVQPQCFFEELKLTFAIEQWQGKGNSKGEFIENQFNPIAEHLAVSLVYDGPKTVTYLSRPTLEKWGARFDELLPRAITNLHRITPDPFQPLQPGLYMSAYEDTHDASRLLLPERVKECRVKGRPLAVAVNRNILLITGEDDFEAQKGFLSVYEKAAELPRPMPPFPLIYENDCWHLWRSPRDNPNHNAFDRLTVVAYHNIYSVQKELVDQLFDLEKTDIFVASYSAWEDQSGAIYSCCVWTESALSLLPKTDTISFVVLKGDSGENLGIYDWDKVMEVAGELLQLDPEFYPTRYRVESFPTKEQFDRMQAGRRG